MTVGQLRQMLDGVPDVVFIVANIPDMLMPPHDLTMRMEAPLLVGNFLPGYIHVVIEPIKGEQ